MALKLGIAPIGWTNDDMVELGSENTFKQCVSEMALAGYTGCEIGNKYPTCVEKLKHQLDIRGLSVCNAWFSTFLTTQAYAETEKAFVAHCDKLHRLGAKVVGVSEQGHSIQGTPLPIFSGRYTFSSQDWQSLCKGLNSLGKLAKENFGIELTYHHHMGTIVQTGAEVDRLLANTDPNYVSLLYDSGHFTYAGEEPLAMAKLYASRIKHVHLKDVRPYVIERVKLNKQSFLDGVRQGTFTVPGDGSIDFYPIIKALTGAGYNEWLVVEAEQDPSVADPYEYALKAMKYIKDIIRKL